ncbi:tryptophan-rich sensory protein [Larkinella insperata]|uniref:Tryptophan-rich sensory protein n=1 Tax=Larkinella insperata TaxID=332158 RepID=A0ABW3Q894_9BACT|nr:tryptophan-rich sensory protein [Larkinella insperata]
MRNSLFWRIGTAALVVGSIVYTVTANLGKRKKEEEEESDNVLPEYRRVFDANPIVPDGWTFATVWSTIYAGTTAYTVHQALPSQQNNPRYRNALPWLATSYVLNAVFGRLFSDPRQTSMIGSDLVTKASLPVALALHQQLEIGKTPVGSPEQYLRIPFSLYAGWLTTASVVGTPNLLLNLEVWKPEPRRDTPVFVGVLGATTAVAYAVARRLNDPYYLLPFVAGFAGIATKQYGRNNAVALTAAVCSLAVGGMAVRWVPGGTFKPLKRQVEEVDPDAEDELWWEELESQNPDSESYSYTSI